MSNCISNLFNKLFYKEPLKVSIRGVLYDVDKAQYKRGITEAVIYKDSDGFILWSTKQGSGKVNCELNLKDVLAHTISLKEFENGVTVNNPRYKGYSIVGSVLSEREAFELIEGC